MRPSFLGVLIAATAAVTTPVSADEPAACGGATAVSRVCTFAYQGGRLSYQVQNVRVIFTGILRDDSVRLDVYNVTQQRAIASCTAIALAAGCGALRDGNGSVTGDVLRCTALGQGAQATVFHCTSTPPLG